MSSINFVQTEVAAAIARGVRQFVVIGSGLPLRTASDNAANKSQVFAVGEEPPSDSPATFVPTKFGAESLAGALEKSDFNRLKATLFVWLGVEGYRTVEATMTSLAFMASLPKGSGVVLDYAVERSGLALLTQTALDALVSRTAMASGRVNLLIQPQAVAAMLRGLGFQKIVDLAQEQLPMGEHFVSAVV